MVVRKDGIRAAACAARVSGADALSEIACEQTNELYRQGKHQAAQEQEQLYEILMTAMEQAELVLGAQEMELDRFLQMFRMLLGCYQVGSIPANLDEVLVSGLDGMRARCRLAI